MNLNGLFLGAYISKPINIKQFRTKHAVPIESCPKTSKITKKTVISKMKEICPDAEVSDVAKEITKCRVILEKFDYSSLFDSPEALNVPRLVPIYKNNNCGLKTLQIKKGDLYQSKRTMLYTSHCHFTPRGNIVPGQNLLITISLYYPFHWATHQVPDAAVFPRRKAVIQFHENQTLYEVKSAFNCENLDSEISGDISENIKKPFEYLANKDLKHAFFYINKNIYIDDLSDGVTKEHAKNMKEWAQLHGHPIGNILSMSTKLLDLEVRIGEPYIYQHLGRCEHLIIFNEIKFAQNNDSLGYISYPRIISIKKEKLKYCIYCSKDIATIVAIYDDDDIRSPTKINHMCDSCFDLYNYDNFGEKIENCSAYRTVKMKK